MRGALDDELDDALLLATGTVGSTDNDELAGNVGDEGVNNGLGELKAKWMRCKDGVNIA